MNELTTAKPQLVVLRERFEARKTELRNMLPSDISPDVFIRAFTTGATLNPSIQACTWQSIWDACIKAARAGLLPDGVEGAIVPFKTQAQWIPMVQGVLRSARRSGQLSWIDANVVRSGETFEYSITQDGPHFLHVPGENFNAIILRAYAVAKTKDGAFYSAVMSKAEIDKHRSYSRAGREDSPWNQWYEAMAIKTAIKGLGKYLPSVRDAIAGDDTVADEIPTIPDGQRFGPGEAITSPTDARAPDAGDTPSEGPGGGEPGEEAPSNPPATDPLVDAYERGKDAKARGHQARALPPEYREPTRTREALAWQAGHAGQSMPTFQPE
jgi:recombination protein RecT